jgi:cyclopropane fatty-acyl-phospholipid synthase-like methyltransferase
MSVALRAAIAAAALLACGEAPAPDHAARHPGAAHTAHDGAGHHHGFADVARFAAIFDDPKREEWQHPAEVVALLDVAPGMTVADVGAGTGYFEPYLARAVGPHGRVLALDVEPNMVAHMRERFASAGLTNVEALRVAPDDPELPAAGVDRILIVDTWHHVHARERYAARLRQALRPGGAVLVVDFTADSPHGPPARMRLAAEEVAAELSAGGLAAEIVPETLPWQYVVRGRAAR